MLKKLCLISFVTHTTLLYNKLSLAMLSSIPQTDEINGEEKKSEVHSSDEVCKFMMQVMREDFPENILKRIEETTGCDNFKVSKYLKDSKLQEIINSMIKTTDLLAVIHPLLLPLSLTELVSDRKRMHYFMAKEAIDDLFVLMAVCSQYVQCEYELQDIPPEDRYLVVE